MVSLHLYKCKTFGFNIQLKTNKVHFETSFNQKLKQIGFSCYYFGRALQSYQSIHF